MIYVSRPVSGLFCRLSVYTDKDISITVQGPPCAPQEHSSKTNILPARGWRCYRAAGAVVVQERSPKIKKFVGQLPQEQNKKRWNLYRKAKRKERARHEYSYYIRERQQPIY